ncbi:hypothetical protein [Pseudomonas sp. M47T1]|uniref:hypothetical protein n=1 Tax=Pseudomonas sp. M47T1 TaxID=1179778 RepID=UPI0012FC5944|nr:hypothetical protein [Pseudomonas sp. M47T1]
MRADHDPFIKGKLPDIKTPPSGHMNYDGNLNYDQSGYLSLFEYKRDQVTFPDGQNSRQSAWYAITQLYKTYVHLVFIPPDVPEVRLSEDNVKVIPDSGRAPCLYNTDNCSPPGKINEYGDVISHANRYINEFLYSGQWAQGMRVITVKQDSAIFGLLQERIPLNEFIKTIDAHWPCNNRDDSNPDAGGPGSAMAVK